jgi:flagellin
MDTEGTLHTAGTVLKRGITLAEDAKIPNDMTLQNGSILKAGSVLTANDAKSGAAEAELGDTEMLRLSQVNVMNQENAQKAIAIADAALKDLDKIRADLGSVQNQLASTISNISTTRVNVNAAESTIRDVDFADESATFTKMQVLMQAGTFAMAQANASSQNVMSLLQ